MSDTKGMTYPFPIRKGWIAVIQLLPENMTKEEAERLAVFIRSLAMPERVDEHSHNTTPTHEASKGVL